MGIKAKFIIILITVSLVPVLFAGFLWGLYQKSHHQVELLQASTGDLYAVRQFRADIYLQISQSVDFLLSGEDEDEESYERFKDNSIRSHQQWLAAINRSTALGEDKTVEQARAVQLKKRFEQASENIDRAFEFAEYGDNEKAYQVIENDVEDWVNYDLSSEVDGALAAEVGEVNEAYDKVLIWLGAMPWSTAETLREVKRARHALNDMLAADRILSTISIQHKDFMDYLFSLDEQERREFDEYELVTQIELRDWANTVSSREELNFTEKQQLLEQIRVLEKDYLKLLEQCRKAFEIKQQGRHAELLSFLQQELQPLFHGPIFKRISNEIIAARAQVDRSSQALVEVTYRAGISGVMVMAAGSLFIVILIFFLMQGILRSLSGLQTGTEMIAAGRFGHRIGLQTNDELGKLAASFDMMCARLARMRSEIVAAKQYTENILTSMKDTLLVVSADGIIQTANEAACQLLQYRQDELVGSPVATVIADGFDGAKGTSGNGHPANVEKQYRRKDGRQLPVSFSSSVLRDASGTDQGFVCVAQDITERKQAEEGLIASERKYRRLSKEFHALLDAIPDSLTLLDPELKILWANKGAERHLGVPGDPLSGQPCHQARPGYRRGSSDCPVMESFASGCEAQRQQVGADGRYYDVRAFPIKDESGKVSSVIEVAVDITGKIKLQADATQAAHLASLGELAAGVAHEINNPINSIINYAQILQDEAGEKGGSAADILQRILDDGDRVANIVRSLLSFARVSREEKLPTAIADVLENTLALTRTQMRKEGINLQIDCPEELPLIMANPQQIEQVFLNLINNSRYALNQKYPGADEKKGLEIAATELEVDGVPRVQIVFHDYGTGIAVEILDQVLHPFFSTKPMGVGTGLGLSISHGIVSDHGGRMAIESSQGQFTRVVIDLPAHLATGQVESEVV